VDRDDVAPVVARVLLERSHRGETLDVTGPQAVTWADVAAALPGAPAYEDVAPDAFAALLREQGLPEALVQGMLGVFADVRAGRFDLVSDAVRTVGGVEPRTLRDTFAPATAAG
jgi:NAD(P)H dehydrogenase (quinone)